MTKKCLLILAVFVFLFGPQVNNSLAEGGTCSCIVSSNRTCGIQTNSCDANAGYIPQCTKNLSNCSPLYSNSCTCVTGNSQNLPSCGGESQPCCTGDTCHGTGLKCTATAAGKRCLTDTQVKQTRGYQLSTPGLDPTCNNGQGISTAIGCVPTNDINAFVGWLLSKVIFIASGIAFLLMAFGAIQIITSAGNPEKIKGGGELITSALSGLLFIILSVFLLKLIGVDILQIPGFSK